MIDVTKVRKGDIVKVWGSPDAASHYFIHDCMDGTPLKSQRGWVEILCQVVGVWDGGGHVLLEVPPTCVHWNRDSIVATGKIVREYVGGPRVYVTALPPSRYRFVHPAAILHHYSNDIAHAPQATRSATCNKCGEPNPYPDCHNQADGTFRCYACRVDPYRFSRVQPDDLY
jgi:hypothetical protein